jgi:DNA polymerase III delta prime subunit
MSTTNKLFTEALRPKELNGMILLPRIYNEVKNGLVQNVLLEGIQGTGKTTLTRILAKGYDTLTINCSEERGIDTIREKIIGFSSSVSLMGGQEKIKVIVLEECDGMTSDAFDSLRAVIEKYADSVRFIGNCNNINKIPAPIQSRFNVIRVAPINQEEERWLFDAYIQYVGMVLNQINCAYTDETIKEFVKVHFPDMRSIINSIQSLYLQGAKELNKDALVKTFECSDLFNLIMTQMDPIENYKLIISEYANKVDETLESISKNFVEFIKVNYPNYSSKIPMCVISIAEHLNMLPNCIDKTIVLLSCVYKLQIILHQ